MTDTQETGAEVIAEYRADADKMDSHELPQPTTQYLRIMLDRLDAAHKRERRLLMSCARWILCHDIYGHVAKELLAECKEVLNDDGQFLFKEDEQ